ncbi:MAG: Kelch repeat-containing protein [Saprospiraceae bacterium]
MTKKTLVLFATLVLMRCSSPKLDTLDFVDTIALPPGFENFDAAKLRGQILHQGTAADGECGFIWAYDRDTVEDLKPDAQRIVLPLPAVGSDGVFEAPVGGLERGRSIYIRTFVTVRDEGAGERSLFSAKTETFAVGEIVANTGIALIFNDSAVVFGQLRGIFESKESVEQHGHVISKTDPLPTLGCSTCIPSFPLGISNINDVFSSGFGGLEFNTTYRVRCYAIANGDTFYSKTVDTFRIRDGWQRINIFPSVYTEATAAVVDGIAYMGFGCTIAFGCPEANLSSNVWKFDPTAQAGNGEWTPSIPFPQTFFKQFNNVSFAVGGKFYAMFGELDAMAGGLQNNLLYFDPATQTWGQNYTDSIFMGRTGAVAFTLEDKAYVGAGIDSDNHEYNDFWEYNPATSHWRQVESLPLQRNPVTPVEFNSGREEAVAFTIQDEHGDEYAYVGAGEYGGLGLRDFWRFRPPANGDLGAWDQVAFLPLEAPGRYRAVAISIGKKGYVGTGFNPTDGYLNDWWEYNPAANQWRVRTSLPAQPRSDATGFAISNVGYLGTGQTKIGSNGGLGATEYALLDFWRYVPEE